MKGKAIVIGSTGLIGSRVVEVLSREYEVLGVSRSTSPAVDITQAPSIDTLFAAVGRFDHVLAVAGDAAFGPLESLDREALMKGVKSKMLGQMQVALAAVTRLPKGGSITLTGGMLAETPIPGSAGVAFVNGALNSFVRAAALEMTGERRINVVSPGWVKETMVRMGLDPAPGMAALDVAELYLQAVQGSSNGEVIKALST